MPTILAGQVVPVFFSSDSSISITPGSAGRVSLNARAQDGSQGVAPREIYSAQTINVQAGTTVVVEAINTDASYTVSSSSGGVVDAASVQAALSSDQAGGRTALGLGTAATQPATAFVQVSDVADLAALLAVASPTTGMRARTVAPVIGTLVQGGVPYVRWIYDGAAWRLDGPQNLLIDYTPASGVAGTSAQVLKTYTCAAGVLPLLRNFVACALYAKSGTTDTGTCRMRIGTAGNETDTLIMQSGGLSASGRTFPVEHRRFATSATNLRQDAGTPVVGYTGIVQSASPYPTNTTVSDMNANALILSASIQMSGSTDVPTVAHFIVTGA